MHCFWVLKVYNFIKANYTLNIILSLILLFSHCHVHCASLNFFLPILPMFYIHHIVYHFIYVLSFKQWLKNIQLYPSWYPMLLIRIPLPPISLSYPIQSPLWIILPPLLSLYILVLLHLVNLPFLLWLFFPNSTVSSCFNCLLHTDCHLKHLS